MPGIFKQHCSVTFQPLLNCIRIVKRRSRSPSVFHRSPFDDIQSHWHAGIGFVSCVFHIVYHHWTVKRNGVKHHLCCVASLLQCSMSWYDDVVLKSQERMSKCQLRDWYILCLNYSRIFTQSYRWNNPQYQQFSSRKGNTLGFYQLQTQKLEPPCTAK